MAYDQGCYTTGETSNSGYSEKFTILISNRAALDEIIKLLKMKVIKKAGKGRSLRYELA